MTITQSQLAGVEEISSLFWRLVPEVGSSRRTRGRSHGSEVPDLPLHLRTMRSCYQCSLW